GCAIEWRFHPIRFSGWRRALPPQYFRDPARIGAPPLRRPHPSGRAGFLESDAGTRVRNHREEKRNSPRCEILPIPEILEKNPRTVPRLPIPETNFDASQNATNAGDLFESVWRTAR